MKFWIIGANDVALQEGTLEKVIKRIHWRRHYQVDNQIAEEWGYVDLPEPDVNSFIDYSTLTYENYCTWLESLLDVASIDASLDAKMDAILNPPMVQFPLPFPTFGTSGTSALPLPGQ